MGPRWQLLPRPSLSATAQLCPGTERWQDLSSWPEEGEPPSPAREAAELAKLGKSVLQGLGPPKKTGSTGQPAQALWVPVTPATNMESWLGYHVGFEEGRIVFAWSGASCYI